MGIKQDRPADHGDDGVVVYVAKSKDEVDKARAALQAAEVSVDLPEAAVEALFAAGRGSLPIRVAAMDFRKAQDVIDEVFPPPLLELPPLPGQGAPEPEPAAAASSGGSAGGGPAPADGAQVDAYRPEPSQRKGSVRKLEGSANKVLFIALASFVLPGIGVLTGIFAAFSAWWCWDQLPYESEAVGRAKAAFFLAIGALVMWSSVAAYFGWLAAN